MGYQSILNPHPVTGPLTDAQLRASSVPVSGTFWQATQPVSIASTLNVSVQNASLAVTGPLTDTQLRAAAVPISAASLPLPSGAATAAKQPAIGTAGGAAADVLTVQGIAAMTPLKVDGSGVTQPVSGTFWQATQPVSIAATVNVSVQNATLAVTAPALTKGTQGSNGFSVQNLKDAGRTLFSACTVIGGVTAVTTEALLTLTPTRAGVAGTAGTSIQATAGKTLRITGIVFSTRSTSAAVLSGRCALRMNPSGAATATSPIIAIAATTQQAAALAEAGDTCVVPIPDGIEISGTQQIGLTQVCSATTGVVYASLIGFEY